MNNLQNNQLENLPKSSTTLAVLERIENEAIAPYSKWRFLLEEWSLWVLWAATVIFGALALSITYYVCVSATYDLYEATHANFYTFFVSVLPYIWVLLFIAMIYLAMVELKKTKHGYRFRTTQVLGSSIFFSVLIASFFHFIGFGYMFDNTLGRQIGVYMSIEKNESRLWQVPESGRLVGFLIPALVNDGVTVTENLVTNFKDNSGTIWRLNTSELNDRESDLLFSMKKVRMLGVKQDEFTFHACAVFPWVFDRPLAFSEMNNERRNFLNRMHEHKGPPEGQSVIYGKNGEEIGTVYQTDNDTICSNLKMNGIFVR